jgi:hypothetical protein
MTIADEGSLVERRDRDRQGYTERRDVVAGMGKSEALK